ncbi:MAG: glutathione S-transferase family protein [Hyphomicrobiales bacterium]|nr:glutathione S-transferase family protein [Hyphomicrobiales bacterium]
MLELYHHGTSVCAAKPRIALAEKGLAWESRYVDILKDEQFSPHYLKLNPKAVVPTLVHDGRVVRESTLIGEYLDDAFPEVPLKPENPFDRVEMRMWTKRLDEELHLACGIVTFAISHRHAVLSNPPEIIEAYVNKAPPAERERRRRKLERGIEDPEAASALLVYDRFLQDMETALSRRPWLAGDTFSLAEVGVIPYINRLDMLSLSGLWTQRLPYLTQWFERIKARPSFEPALFGYAPMELRELMRKRGAQAWPQVCAIVKGSVG